MAIDDPLEALQKHWNEPSANLTAEMAIAMAGIVFPAAGLVQAMRGHFSAKAASERVRALLEIFGAEMRRHGAILEDLEARMHNEGFMQTLMEAVEAAARGASRKRIERMALVLGGSMVDAMEPTWDEVGALVNDLAKLTDHDLKALKVIVNAHPGFPGEYDAHPPVYTKRLKELIAEFRKMGFSSDAFYAHAARLAGFGLVLEVPIKHAVQVQEAAHLCFRPTKRGVRLLTLLKNEGT